MMDENNDLIAAVLREKREIHIRLFTKKFIGWELNAKF